MALADTARLIASLELQDKFSGTGTKAERQLGRIEGTLQKGTRQMGIFGTATATALGIGLSRAVGAGVRLITGAVTGGVESLNQLQSVTVATNTVLDSTKGVSGQTAAGVRALSEEYENLNATMDDKVIQSGANMLLTFTNIRTKAFEPALEAALNMNEAMGGGPEGLQSTIIQVGKALNDPIKGVGALRKVGVQLSAQQEKQIKTLIEQNDLYGAQRIILDELTTQFGGRFAAAGKTAEGRQAAFNDRIEDLQKKLAGPLIPVIDRVREKLIDLMGSPAALAAADKLGQAIADLANEENLGKVSGFLDTTMAKLADLDLSNIGSDLTDALTFVGDLPWDAMGSAFQLMGTGARAALDIFTSMPPWVQTAVLTGWGLNKLTGGAVGGLIGELGKGLVKGVLGMNAGVVNINAAAVNGPGGGIPGVAGKGGGGLLGGLKTGAALAAPLLVGVAAVEVINFETMRNEQRAGLQGILDELPRTPQKIQESIDRIDEQINMERPLLDGILFNTNVKPQLEAERAELVRVKDAQERSAGLLRDAIPWHQRNVDAVHQFNASEGTRFANLGAKQDAVNASIQAQHGVLSAIRDKNQSVNVSVYANSYVTISDIQRRIVSSQIAAGTYNGLAPT